MLMMLLPMSLYVNDLMDELTQTEREAQGMPPIMAVNSAVQRLQAHRGTTAGMLGGDSAMAARRPALRDAVNLNLSQALEQLRHAQAPQAAEHQLQQLIQTWQKLEAAVNSQSIDAPQSMAQHTRLVTDLLGLNEVLMHHYSLMVTPHADNQALIQALLSQAPLLSENLGLLRGQGTGFLAQAELPAENRGALRALERRIGELLAASGRALERGMRDNPDYRSALSGPAKQVTSLTTESLRMAGEQLIEASSLTLAPTQFFDTLTQAIDAVNSSPPRAPNYSATISSRKPRATATS